MLYLRTGLPGGGKTLNTIKEIDEANAPDPENPLLCKYPDPAHPDAPPRLIYYNGIPELQVDRLQSNWIEFDTPEEWFNVPDGSIIVIDEAQRIFGATETKRPEKVARFETHRHQGLDIHLVTQDPSLLCKHVRVLVGKHIHVWRPYGREKGVIRHEYEMCCDSPNKRSNFSLAQEDKIDLDSNYFGLYKSATVHTHKKTTPPWMKKLPWIITLLVVTLGILAGLAYGVWRISEDDKAEALKGTPHGDQPAQPRSANGRQVASSDQAPGSTGTAVSSSSKSLEAYALQNTPRVPDLPSSAPVFDDMTKPKDFPRLNCASSTDMRIIDSGRVPTAVINGKAVACKCYTQQATVAKVSVEFCMDVVTNGMFDPTRPQASVASGASTTVGRPQGSGPAPQTGSTFGDFFTGKAPAQPVAASSGDTPKAEYYNTRYTQQTALSVVPDTEYTSRPWR